MGPAPERHLAGSAGGPLRPGAGRHRQGLPHAQREALQGHDLGHDHGRARIGSGSQSAMLSLVTQPCGVVSVMW